MSKIDLRKLLTEDEYKRLKQVDSNMFYTEPPKNQSWKKKRKAKRNG